MTYFSIGRLAFLSLSAIALARATTIDFESQGASAPPGFNSSLNSPLVIGLATFTGGKLLKNEVASTGTSADLTAVYATTGFLAGYTDPLVITFSQPVSNVSLIVTNETPDTYTLADNRGGSSAMLVGYNVDESFSLSDANVTQVSISTAATVGWDFAIDNVSFTTVSPEPDMVWPQLAALVGLVLLSLKRHQMLTRRQ